MRDNKLPGIRALVKWDWTSNNISGKWEDLGDIYNTGNSPALDVDSVSDGVERAGESLSVIKLGVLGTGKSIRFRFESVDDRPLTLHGWAVTGSEEINP